MSKQERRNIREKILHKICERKSKHLKFFRVLQIVNYLLNDSAKKKLRLDFSLMQSIQKKVAFFFIIPDKRTSSGYEPMPKLNDVQWRN